MMNTFAHKVAVLCVFLIFSSFSFEDWFHVTYFVLPRYIWKYTLHTWAAARLKSNRLWRPSRGMQKVTLPSAMLQNQWLLSPCICTGGRRPSWKVGPNTPRWDTAKNTLPFRKNRVGNIYDAYYINWIISIILRPVLPKNNRRLQLFFDRKTGGCVVEGHVKKCFVKKIIAAGYYL